MEKLKFIPITLLILVLTAGVILHNQQKSRVLIVYSYDKNLDWVKQVDRGIVQYLAKNPSGVTIRRHYMEVNKYKNCDYYRIAANDVKLTIQDWQPQVVVIVDDLGQALVGANYLHFKPDAKSADLYDNIAKSLATGICPNNGKAFFNLQNLNLATPPTLIFAGVNGDVEQYGYRLADNVTGIFEHKNLLAMKETINDIYEATPKGNKPPTSIQLLGDDSATSRSEHDLFNKFKWATLIWKEPKYAKNFKEWQDIVTESNKNGSMLLVFNYREIREEEGGKSFVPTTKLIQWTEEQAKYPVLGASTAFLDDGGMLTIAVPGYEQGEISMELATKIIGGVAPSQLPYREPKQFSIGMNKKLVEKRSLELPLMYEAFSRESNNFKGTQ